MRSVITDDNSLLSESVLAGFRLAQAAVFSQEILPEFLMESEADALELSDRIEVDITVTEPEEIRAINAEYRGIDRATDVLSFPQYEDKESVLDALEFLEDGQSLLLGDVVLCYAQAMEQAEQYGNTPERELCYLYVHSLMHLLGYDHIEDEDRRVMREHEESVMRQIGLTRED